MPNRNLKRTGNFHADIDPTKREQSNLEAERGESVVTNVTGSYVPELLHINGKRHSEGGTPLDLPNKSFIFSRDKSMEIRDPRQLERFGIKSKGELPATISAKYDTSKLEAMLNDKTLSKLRVDTLKRMIDNNVNKLGELALYQESMKGFENGIPSIAMPFISTNGIDLSFINNRQQEGQEQTVQKQRLGGAVNVQLRKLQKGGPGDGDVQYFDPSKPDFHPEKIKVGDMYLKDGKWSKVTGSQFKPTNMTSSQPILDKVISDIDTDQTLRDQIIKGFKAHLNDKDTPPEIKAQMMKMTPDQVIENFKETQRQNYAIVNSGVLYQKDNSGKILFKDGMPVLKSDAELKPWETNNSEMYQAAAKALNLGTPLSKAQIASSQAVYRGLMEQGTKLPEGFINLSGKETLTNLGLKDAHGKNTYMGLADTPVDAKKGNTDVGQTVIPTNAGSFELTFQDEEPDGKDKKKDDGKTKINGIEGDGETPQNKFWTEDRVNLFGAVNNFLKTKKYMPLNIRVQSSNAEPTFADPTREIASLSEQANASKNAITSFEGAQGLNSRLSSINGSMAANIANTLGRVSNQNVGIDNQFEQYNNQLSNRASATNAALASKNWEENTVANQQFDNEKAQGREQMRKAFNTAWTNRGLTQNINSLNENYYIDPTTGYKVFYPGGRERELSPAADNVDMSGLKSTYNEVKKLFPEATISDFTELVKAMKGESESNSKKVKIK